MGVSKTALFLVLMAAAVAVAAALEPSTFLEDAGVSGRAGGRIVGGTPASRGQFPWQVAIMYDVPLDGVVVDGPPFQFCGGSLIASRWVLTAAHCFETGSGVGDSVNTGIAVNTLHQQGYDADAKFALIKRVYLHREYNPLNSKNDIALLYLDRHVDGVEFAPLADEDAAIRGIMAEVSGWGATSSGGPSSEDLLYVSVPTVANDECFSAEAEASSGPLFTTDKVFESSLCAGFAEGGKDSCQGDSGGPLSAMIDGKRVQIGVVSWGIGCAWAGFNGVYASVPYYRDWIAEVMAGGRANVAERKYIGGSVVEGQQCTGHGGCTEFGYCDSGYTCYPVCTCPSYDDAIDGTCPAIPSAIGDCDGFVITFAENYLEGFGPQNAIDGDDDTAWIVRDAQAARMVVSGWRSHSYNRITITREALKRAASFEVIVNIDGGWYTVLAASTGFAAGNENSATFSFADDSVASNQWGVFLFSADGSGKWAGARGVELWWEEPVSGIVAYSDMAPGFPPSFAFDGDRATQWYTQRTSNQFVVYQWSNLVNVYGVVVHYDDDRLSASRFMGSRRYYEYDAVMGLIETSEVFPSPAHGPFAIHLGEALETRWIGLELISSHGDDKWINIAEIDFMMEDIAAPTAMFASTVGAQGYEAAMVFVDGSSWVADESSGFIVIDAGEPGRSGVSAVTLFRDNPKRMRDVTIEAMDGFQCCNVVADWTQVDSFTADESMVDIVRNFESVTIGRYWKFSVLNTYGDGGKHAGIAGIDFTYA